MWNKLSPNEKAVIIGLPATILAGVIVYYLTAGRFSSNTSGVSGTRSVPTDQPVLRSYFAYFSVLEAPVSTSPDVRRVTMSGAITFETAPGTEALYSDRVETDISIDTFRTFPMLRVLNPNSYPRNPTRLEFQIQPAKSSDNILRAEGVGHLLMTVREKSCKIGPHLPYKAEEVVLFFDLSHLAFKPYIRGEIESPSQNGVKQTGVASPVIHDLGDGIVSLVAHDVPADSSVLIAWGAE